MKYLINIARAGIFIHLLWAGITAAIVTFSFGDIVPFRLSVFGSDYVFAVGGIRGETEYGWVLWSITLISRVTYLYGFFHLLRMFGQFAQKRFFSIEAINHLRIFAALFALYTLLSFAIETIYITFVQSGDIFKQAILKSPFLGGLFFATLFFILVHILNEARKNEEEIGTYF